MRKNLLILCSILSSLTIAGCAIQRAQIATKAKTSMIGMSKQQVLQCMGAASGSQHADNTDVWKYFSGGVSHGNVNVFTNNQYSYGTVNTTHLSCEINIVFINGTVSKVVYSGNTGGLLAQDEQCSYSISNCVH